MNRSFPIKQPARAGRILAAGVIGLLPLASGCQWLPSMPQLGSSQDETAVQVLEPETLNPAVELEYHILVGELAVQRGNRRQAAQSYVAALEYSQNPELAQRAARIALFAGEPELAFQAAEVWAQTSPDSLDAHKTTARLALRAGNGEALVKHVNRVVALHSDGVSAGLRNLPEVLSGEPDQRDIAMQTSSAVVQRHADYPEAHYSQGLLALRYGLLEEAESASRQALMLKPGWVDAILLRAGVLVRQDKLAEAEALVDGIRGNRADRAEHHLAFARQLLDADAIEPAARQFEHVLALEPANSDARYGLGLLAMSLEDWDRAEKAFLRLYRDGDRQDDAAYYLGNIAASREEYAQARDWYGKVDGGSHLFEARIRSARARYHGGDLPGAREELVSLRQKLPELSERFYRAEGEILMHAQAYEQALQVYNQALAKLPGEPDLLYGRSLVYERLGRIDAATADLRSILAEDPDNPRVLNALGYLLSNHSERYQEALGYIEKALEAQPDDPAVIDSMGWVHYRLGDLATARGYLEKAYSKLNDPEVAAHLGEVLWKMGEREQAQRIWQEALLENPDHPVLNETVKRLSQ